MSRFVVDVEDADGFAQDLVRARDVLAAQKGYVDGAIGRSLDDPTLWVLHTRWADVGSYRRALSAYEVKLTAVPLLSRAVDEPSAYELLDDGGTEALNRSRPRQLG